MKGLQEGAYVLGTQWADGDSREPWAIGYFAGVSSTGKYKIRMETGKTSEHEFSVCKEITQEQAQRVLNHKNKINDNPVSLWKYIDSKEEQLLQHKELLTSKGVQVTHIVAIDVGSCIGKDNQLQWDVKPDMKRFSQMTSGHVILMGRKTFESLGRVLPRREHVVLTRDEEYAVPEGVTVAYNLEQALNSCLGLIKRKDLPKNIYVIGGAEIYNMTMPLADKLEVTHVQTHVKDGDAFYPHIPKDMQATSWVNYKEDPETNTPAYSFATYEYIK